MLRGLLSGMERKLLVEADKGVEVCAGGWVVEGSESGRIALLVGLLGVCRRRSARSDLCLVWWAGMLGCRSYRLCEMWVGLVGCLDLGRSVVIEACVRRRCYRRALAN